MVELTVLLTIAACPLRDTLTKDVTAAVRSVPGVTDLHLTLGVMTDEQRTALRDNLQGGATKDIPFARPESRTRVYAVASGKGGVGKSTVTVNLAAALAAKGLAVGVLDADVYGFSIPRMLGVTGRPTRIGEMILPPVAHGVKVISVGMFVDGNVPVVWRGPMLHRALQQFLADVFWGDLDVLLLDLPPGTGDIAISTAQLIPTAELLVVTTPQTAASEVAERAGAIVTADPAADRRCGGEHVGDDAAGRIPARTVRLRRRRRRCRLAEPAHRNDRAPVGSHPARGGTADRGRRRGAAGAGRGFQPGDRGAAGRRRRAGGPQSAAGRRVAGDRARPPLRRPDRARGEPSMCPAQSVGVRHRVAGSGAVRIERRALADGQRPHRSRAAARPLPTTFGAASLVIDWRQVAAVDPAPTRWSRPRWSPPTVGIVPYARHR